MGNVKQILSNRTGQVVSKSQIAEFFGISLPTLRNYVLIECTNGNLPFNYHDWIKRKFVSQKTFEELKRVIL